MLTNEEKAQVAKDFAQSGHECALYAKMSDDSTQMELTIFTLTNRKIAVADVIASIAYFTAETINSKVQGKLQAPWSPRDLDGKLTPRPEAKGSYWGET